MIAGLCNKTVSKLKYVKKLNNMVILLEIIISWYSSTYFHIMCTQFKDGVILVPQNQLEQLKHLNTKIQWCKLQSLRKKNNTLHKSCRYNTTPGSFSDNVTPSVYYFTDGPVVQYDVSVVKKYFCIGYCIKMV